MQSARAATVEKTRVRVKCIVRVIKFCGQGGVCLKILREELGSGRWGCAEDYNTGYRWQLKDMNGFPPF